MVFQVKEFMNPTFNSIDNRVKKSYQGILNLSSNELHHPVLRELSQQFYHQHLGEITRCYPNYAPAQAEIAQLLKVSPEQVLLTPGSDFTINLLLTYLGNHKSVILCNPEYYSYNNYALINGLKIVKMDVQARRLDALLESYLDLIAMTQPSLVVLSNPNGITGYHLRFEDIQKIAKCCYEHNHLLLIDEAYTAFSRLNHLPLLNKYKNLIVMRSYSKSHGIAGLRFSCVFSSAEIIGYLRKTGVENAVSGISLAYFNFLLKNNNTINEILEDIDSIKQDMVAFLRGNFTSWNIYNTSTHFLTVDIHDKTTAKKITKFFDAHKIAIKCLDSVSDLKTCIRFTIPETKHIDSLKKYFIQFKNEFLNV